MEGSHKREKERPTYACCTRLQHQHQEIAIFFSILVFAVMDKSYVTFGTPAMQQTMSVTYIWPAPLLPSEDALLHGLAISVLMKMHLITEVLLYAHKTHRQASHFKAHTVL
jgi:hypothetical protein